MSFTARAKITAQLWDVVEHLKPSGTLEKGTVVQVLRRRGPEHVVIFHEGVVHTVFKHHLELV